MEVGGEVELFILNQATTATVRVGYETYDRETRESYAGTIVRFDLEYVILVASMGLCPTQNLVRECHVAPRRSS
jgi:hypothetical protein